MRKLRNHFAEEFGHEDRGCGMQEEGGIEAVFEIWGQVELIWSCLWYLFRCRPAKGCRRFLHGSNRLGRQLRFRIFWCFVRVQAWRLPRHAKRSSSPSIDNAQSSVRKVLTRPVFQLFRRESPYAVHAVTCKKSFNLVWHLSHGR